MQLCSPIGSLRWNDPAGQKTSGIWCLCSVITTLYWNFLDTHRKRFAANGRMKNQYANLARKDSAELRAIRRQAAAIAEASA